MDPVQKRRVHGDLMNDVNYEAQYINNKYNIWTNPLYFELDTFIHTR